MGQSSEMSLISLAFEALRGGNLAVPVGWGDVVTLYLGGHVVAHRA